MTRAFDIAYVGLGSNLGNSEQILCDAIRMLDALPDSQVIAQSEFHRTDPVGPIVQPAFINGVVAIETQCSPRDLLTQLLRIERAHGRDRNREQRWGPRLLDLDLLMYGCEVLHEPDLTLPHPRMHERLFVLRPLAEIAPGARHPVLGRTIAELLSELPVGEGEKHGGSIEPSAASGVQTAVGGRR